MNQRQARRSLPPEENSGVSLCQPTGLRLSSEDRWRQLIRQELFRHHLNKQEAETFEEADDFDLDDDEEWFSDYEVEFDPPSPDANTPPNGSTGTPPPVTPGEGVPSGGGNAPPGPAGSGNGPQT